MIGRIALAAAIGCGACLPLSAQTAPVAPASAATDRGGTLPGGARWDAEVPPHWNGTLLLWSRGYSPRAGGPEAAPAAYRRMLLDRGYALAGSDYGAGGWAWPRRCRRSARRWPRSRPATARRDG